LKFLEDLNHNAPCPETLPGSSVWEGAAFCNVTILRDAFTNTVASALEATISGFGDLKPALFCSNLMAPAIEARNMPGGLLHSAVLQSRLREFRRIRVAFLADIGLS